MPLDDPQGATAVVTGAGSGIGRAMVEHFAALGMTVAAVDIDEAPLAATMAAAGDRAEAFVVDVTDADAVASLADAVEQRWGVPQLLCNNAGVFQAGRAWECRPADWRWAFDVNLFGIINGVDAFVPRMLDAARPAHVVNTSSVAGFVAAPMTGPYNVSKVAAFSFTECLAHDLAGTGLPVGASVLCPSAIRTGIAHTDRLRPAGDGDEHADAAMVRGALAAMTDAGIEAAEVPPIVLDGIRAGDFLIATKPSYAAQLDARFGALTARQLPPTPAID